MYILRSTLTLCDQTFITWCNSIRTIATFITEVCVETFKTQSGPLNCNSEKVLYWLKCKVLGKSPYIGKTNIHSQYRFNNSKNIRLSRKEIEKYPQTFFHNHYCVDDHLGTDDWDFILFDQCETWDIGCFCCCISYLRYCVHHYYYYFSRQISWAKSVG